jgi:hypothetical protein
MNNTAKIWPLSTKLYLYETYYIIVIAQYYRLSRSRNYKYNCTVIIKFVLIYRTYHPKFRINIIVQQ